MPPINLFNSARIRLQRWTKFVHSVIFGNKNLLITNALISASMGAIGDSIQQNYDILMNTTNTKRGSCQNETIIPQESSQYSIKRTLHMTMAGLTTGVTTHYWYQTLERIFGSKRRPVTIVKLVLLDQIIFSPINLFVYFATLSLCEQSGWEHFQNELIQKGLENIYIVEWLIWPPAQLINFALLPLRYRILFDNIVSLGFDIYAPYVKYKTQLKDEQIQSRTSNPNTSPKILCNQESLEKT